LAVVVTGGHLERLASLDPGQAEVPHQPLDGAPGDVHAFPVELAPHLVRPVHAADARLPHPGDLALEVLVPDGAR